MAYCHCEGKHEQGGWQGESQPCRETAGDAGAKDSKGEADLAAGGPGEGLGEGDDFGECGGGAPFAAFDEFALEVAEVSDGAAEAGAAEAKEG